MCNVNITVFYCLKRRKERIEKIIENMEAEKKDNTVPVGSR